MGGEGQGRRLLHMAAERVADSHRATESPNDGSNPTAIERNNGHKVRLRVEGCVTVVTEGEENKRGVCVLYAQTYTYTPSRSASLRPLLRTSVDLLRRVVLVTGSGGPSWMVCVSVDALQCC
ncbi:unnamed protein product [Vitrella brassicaformis CCMP3155]|uniref:Uncharacterized protein n=1 Tax=Vitrella brassicaformis (strain CCMP3155) TaxID=1169540 RepID=A0A0G4F792_VITBC|nr:unnamed protein product [Vitrella brassicaformis CCMP3155]|eukprot:CEM08125.1 unnamed protein product [Vitrella brassicaformis CCMP3155]